MTEEPRKALPRKAAARTAKLAALPLGYAGRSALGLGKRIGGKPADAVMSEIQQRTAEQLFRTLGELKGGAMKVGQMLSVLESAFPEEMAVVGYDDIEFAAYTFPPLTTVRQPAEQLGTMAAQTMIAHLDNEAPLPRSIAIEPHLVVRQSVRQS